MIASLIGVEVGQITAAVAGGAEFSTQTGLPLEEQYLIVFVFRSRQCRRHAGGSAADDSDDHKLHLLSIMLLYRKIPPDTRKTSFQNRKDVL